MLPQGLERTQEFYNTDESHTTFKIRQTETDLSFDAQYYRGMVAADLLETEGTVFERSEELATHDYNKVLGVEVLTYDQQPAVDLLRQEVFGSSVYINGESESFASIGQSLAVFHDIVSGKRGENIYNQRLLFSALNQHLDWLIETERITDEDFSFSGSDITYPLIMLSVDFAGLMNIFDGNQNAFLLELGDLTSKLAVLDNERGHNQLSSIAMSILGKTIERARAIAIGKPFAEVLCAQDMGSYIDTSDMYTILLGMMLSLDGGSSRARNEPMFWNVEADPVALSEKQFAYLYCCAKDPSISKFLEAKYPQAPGLYERILKAFEASGQDRDWFKFEKMFELNK